MPCADPLRRRLAAIAVLAAAAVWWLPVRGQAGESLQVALALGGVVRAGHAAELAVSVRSGRTHSVTVHLDGATQPVRVTAPVEAGVPRTVWIPVLVDGDGPVRARLTADGLRLTDASVWPEGVLPAGEQLVATAMAIPLSHSAPWTVWQTPVDSLPRTAAGYGPVSALVLDADTLAGMDLRQQQALEAYLAGCGRVLAVDLPQPAVEALADAAGCGGELFRAAGSTARLDGLVNDLFAVSRPALPGTGELAALLPEPKEGRFAWTLGVLLAAYFVAMGGVAWSARARWLLVLLPPGVCGLALLLWNGAAPSGGAVAWLERDAGGGARAALLARVQGRGRGQALLALFPDMVAPHGVARVVAIDAAGRQRQGAVIALRMLSRLQLQGTATVRLPSDLELFLDADGPVVVNRGDARSPAGTLFLGERTLRVPPLMPGTRWSAEAATPRARDTPALRLAAARTPAEGAALLVPGEDALAMPGDVNARLPVPMQTWLLIRARDA